MPTITVKLDKQRAAQLARVARAKKKTKSEVLRDLIDQSGKIITGDDLEAWVSENEGRSFGLSTPPQ